MLGNELMAGLALGVFWVHVLLIAGAAGLDFRDLLRLRGRMRRGVVCGVVRRGDGADGVLARNVVAQVGRGKGDGSVHFSDAAYRSEVFGGVVELEDGRQLECTAGEFAVWPDLERRAATAASQSNVDFDRVEAQAKRAKGFEREVVGAVGVGDRVWIAGRVDDGRVAEPILVSAMDPLRWVAGRCWLIVGFVIAELALAAGCTATALWPPMFGVVSMIGAAAALGFFLGVQPIGVLVNEAVRTPDRAYLRGSWRRG